jgi:hypothetical protein
VPQDVGHGERVERVNSRIEPPEDCVDPTPDIEVEEPVAGVSRLARSAVISAKCRSAARPP